MNRDRRAPDPHQIGVDRNEIADIDGFAKVHRLDRNGHGAGFRDLGSEHAAADIHLAQQPAAEDVAIGVGIGRHRQGADAEIAARLGLGRERRLQIGFDHLKFSQPASGVNRPPNFSMRARSVATTFSGPRVRA